MLVKKFEDELYCEKFEPIRTICLLSAGKKLQNKICKTTSIYSLFDLLTCNPLFFNWMNVEYLEILASVSGNENLICVLKDYTDVILSKTLGEIWDCIPSLHNSTKTRYYAKVRSKFQEKDPDDVKVKELTEKCKPKFIKKIALHIMQVNKGSLMITWCMLAEEAYQAYLSALNIPEGCREDDVLQIGVWVVHQPQFVIQELKKIHGK